MTKPTSPLREEHRELRPFIEQLRFVADDVSGMNVAALRAQLDEVHEFLALHLIPHARAEDDALYPVVARLLGGPSSTATMSRDHVAIVQLVDQLAAARHALAEAGATDEITAALRRILYGLHALVTTHLAKEEEIYFPLLDAHLSLDEASDVLAKMGRSAVRAKELLRAPAT